MTGAGTLRAIKARSVTVLNRADSVNVLIAMRFKKKKNRHNVYVC